jgi:hypothetical protein
LSKKCEAGGSPRKSNVGYITVRLREIRNHR